MATVKRITHCDRCGRDRAPDDASMWMYVTAYNDTTEATKFGGPSMFLTYQYCGPCMGSIAAAMRPAWQEENGKMPHVGLAPKPVGVQ